MTLQCRPTRALFLLAACLMAGSPVAAQTFAIDRGSVLIDGQASFSSTGQEFDGESNDDRVTRLSLSPALQYFFTRGLAVGGEMIFSRISVGGDVFTSYGIGPVVTYYFGKEERPWYPYVGASLRFVTESTDEDTDEDDLTEFGYRAAGGVVFMVARGIGINAELFYNVVRRDAFIESRTDQFGLAAGISVFVF